MVTTSTKERSSTTWVKAWPATVLSVGFLVAIGCSRPAAPIRDSQAAQTGTVTVVFSLPSGEVRREIDGVAAGTTIVDVLSKIDDPKIEVTGSGDMAFVNLVGDLGTTEGEGWTFKVDGKWADRGIGAYELSPPATIHCSHGKFDPSDQ